MAKIEPLAKFIFSYEGGFVNDSRDSGGATNCGVTIATWKAQGYDKDGDGDVDVADLKLITKEDATTILRKNYWNRWKADEIEDQGIANILVDWLWASGKSAITIPQQMLGVKVDGIVGPKTIYALNRLLPEYFFKKLKDRRQQYIYNVVKASPAKRCFLKGWVRRNNALYHNCMIDNDGNMITWK